MEVKPASESMRVLAKSSLPQPAATIDRETERAVIKRPPAYRLHPPGLNSPWRRYHENQFDLAVGNHSSSSRIRPSLSVSPDASPVWWHRCAPGEHPDNSTSPIAHARGAAPFDADCQRGKASGPASRFAYDVCRGSHPWIRIRGARFATGRAPAIAGSGELPSTKEADCALLWVLSVESLPESRTRIREIVRYGIY